MHSKRKENVVMLDNEKTAKIFKAFSDPNRISILQQLQHGEKCACGLLEEMCIGQPTLSHHMRILVDAEIVKAKKSGKWTNYTLNKEGIEHAKALLESITTPSEKN